MAEGTGSDEWGGALAGGWFLPPKYYSPRPFRSPSEAAHARKLLLGGCRRSWLPTVIMRASRGVLGRDPLDVTPVLPQLVERDVRDIVEAIA